MKKFFTLFAALMMLSASAETLTVFEGTATNQDIPVSSRFLDWAPCTQQVIYPAAQLTAMQGQDITSVKYYIANEGGSTLSGSTVSLYIGTTETNDFSGYSVNFLPADGMTKVAEMTLTTGVQELEFVFSEGEAWNYTGGNIVIQTVVETDGSVVGSTGTDFLGVSGTYASVVGRSYASAVNFGPMTTFTYGGEPVEITSYTVVGPESIFGTNWDTNDESNNMVLDEATGVYSWYKEGVTLYGNFDFKVVGNHSYDIYQWPIYGNWTANLTEGEGIYTIAITFDPNAEEDLRITCTLTKTGDIGHVEHTYTVAGTENLFGSFWSPADTNNDMVKGEDGLYTWTKNNVVFEDAAEIKFKVTQDHSWDYAWPSSDWVINDVTEAGTYDFVITFNADTKEITCTVTKHGAEPEGLRGDVNDDKDVSIGDVTALIDYLLSGDDTGLNLVNANCNLDEEVSIGDVTALIDYLLSGVWAN